MRTGKKDHGGWEPGKGEGEEKDKVECGMCARS